MSGLSQNDPEPTGGRRGPPVMLVVAILLIVLVIVGLHITGVVGPASH